MSNTVAGDEASAGPLSGRKAARVTNAALWILQAGLAIQFAGAGYLKLSSHSAMIDLFADIRAGQWLRYAVGALEVAGAAGLLIPLLSGLAALGLSGLMVGAAITNQVVLDESPWLPIGLLLAAALVAAGRWSRTSDLAGRLHRGART